MSPLKRSDRVVIVWFVRHLQKPHKEEFHAKIFLVLPGQHQFWSQVISQDSITLTVEAGKIYYVRGDVQIGVYAGRPKFTLISESQGKVDLSRL